MPRSCAEILNWHWVQRKSSASRNQNVCTCVPVISLKVLIYDHRRIMDTERERERERERHTCALAHAHQRASVHIKKSGWVCVSQGANFSCWWGQLQGANVFVFMLVRVQACRLILFIFLYSPCVRAQGNHRAFVLVHILKCPTFVTDISRSVCRKHMQTFRHVDLGCHPYTYFTCGVSFA